MQYNGSGMVAMVGKNCVAIASDMRFGIQQSTIATDLHKVMPQLFRACYVSESLVLVLLLLDLSHARQAVCGSLRAHFGHANHPAKAPLSNETL